MKGDNMANKRWIHEQGNFEKLQLIFEPFYKEEVVGELFKDEDNDWCYSSELLGINDTYLCNRDVCEHDAKLELEEMIFEHYGSERDYYQSLIDMFCE